MLEIQRTWWLFSPRCGGSVYVKGPVWRCRRSDSSLESHCSDPLLKDLRKLGRHVHRPWLQWWKHVSTKSEARVWCLPLPLLFGAIWAPSLLAPHSGLIFPSVGRSARGENALTAYSVVCFTNLSIQCSWHSGSAIRGNIIVFILKSDLIITWDFSEVLYLSMTLVIKEYSNCLYPRIDFVTLNKTQQTFYLAIN